MNECEKTGMCTNGQCVNMMGSYKCFCNPGFRLSEDGHVCVGQSPTLFATCPLL